MSVSLPDLSDFFRRYEELAHQAESLFDKISQEYPSEVSCKKGCSNCCYALFDLSLIEALYVNHKFNELIKDPKVKTLIRDRADATDRKLVKLKRDLYREAKSGKESNAILEEAAKAQMRCPLLDDEGECSLYEARPVTCRVYGVPTAIGGKGYTCGITKFSKGKQYPTVNMDKVQEKLAALSEELAGYIQTSYSELHEVYVPVSFALITTYDAAYLGVKEKKANQS